LGVAMPLVEVGRVLPLTSIFRDVIPTSDARSYIFGEARDGYLRSPLDQEKKFTTGRHVAILLSDAQIRVAVLLFFSLHLSALTPSREGAARIEGEKCGSLALPRPTPINSL
jgi:hypothetical protein